MTVLPRSLGGQLLALLIGALVAAQAVTLLIFADDRAGAVRNADRSGLLEGTASVMRVLALTPMAGRAALAEAAGSNRIRYWVSETSALPSPGASAAEALPSNRIDRLFGTALREPARIAFVDGEGKVTGRPERDDDDDRRGPPWSRQRMDVIVSAPFSDGGWLNAQTHGHSEPVPLPLAPLLSTGLMALAIFAIVGVVARRVTRPLVTLAEHADAFGRGAAAADIPVEGPREVRRLTAAFNHMQERVSRFIADRTRMLAAIGHDLRTPITSLKLRAELLDDEETRDRMVATLDDMQRITEATLAFAREDAAGEPVRSVDLDALLDSLAEDLKEMGKPVEFTQDGRVVYPCRPTALKRAVGNLVENAIRYGGRARLGLADTPEGPVISVDDDGPGIPEDKLEEVFKPFVRLEGSRSRDTGGAGLGLSIARSIVLAHGGTLTLANRAGGGLRAEIRLPKADAH